MDENENKTKQELKEELDKMYRFASAFVTMIMVSSIIAAFGYGIYVTVEGTWGIDALKPVIIVSCLALYSMVVTYILYDRGWYIK